MEIVRRCLTSSYSPTLQYTDLHHLDHINDGGSSVIYSAEFQKHPVVVKVCVLLVPGV